MAWVQILTTTQTNNGKEVTPKYPTTFRIEGTIADAQAVTLQSRRKNGTVWNTEHNFSNTSKSTTVVGFSGGSTVFKIVSSPAGVEGFSETAAPNNDPG